MIRPATIALTAATLLGCAAPQTPYHFLAPTVSADPANVVARALAANGHEPVRVDKGAGIVMTKWEDTGYGFGFVQDKPATVVRRFTVTLARTPAGEDVTVRQDGKLCQTGAGYTIGDLDVRGPCEVMSDVVEPHQRDVDQLGIAIRQALAQAR